MPSLHRVTKWAYAPEKDKTDAPYTGHHQHFVTLFSRFYLVIIIKYYYY